MTLPESDEVMIALVAIGDEPAFARLMKRHARKAMRIADGILRSGHEADDVVQEAFIRVWKKAADFDSSRGLFSTWLYRIIINLCLDKLRRRVNREPIEAADYVEDEALSPLNLLIENELRELINIGMDGLKGSHRVALMLIYREGMTGREAASTLELSDKAFESLLLRARLALKQEVRRIIAPDENP